MPKIFAYICAHVFKDVLVKAISEDGIILASHISSGVPFAKHDIGIMSTWKHDRYRAYYPEGFEIKWVDDSDDPKVHPEFLIAIEKYCGYSMEEYEIKFKPLQRLG